MRGFGPCLCGDPECSSCGPAQGYYRCVVCGEIMDCECDKESPEYAAELAAINQQERDVEVMLDAIEVEREWLEERLARSV